MILQSQYQKTFRNEQVIGQYELTREILEEIKDDYKIPDVYSVGVIYGNSGTGKTQLAKKLFDFKPIEYTQEQLNRSILDMFPENLKVSEITEIFLKVGLGTPKSWIKKYDILSNGQKMRFDLAYQIMTQDFICFDEFTSVVDRNVAYTICKIVNKIIKKANKKMVVISCHSDILEWIEYDWVIDTNFQTISFETSKKKLKNYRYSEFINNTVGNCLANIII